MHIPVLQKEVILYLAPQKNKNMIDATLGAGGHTTAILEKNGPKGKVLALDADKLALSKTGFKKEKRVTVIHENFAHLQETVKKEKFRPVHGILFDLGFSTDQIEQSGRGFTFRKDEPLDMRYDTASPTTAEKILNYWSKQDLEKILKEYGEEQFAKQIAKAITKARSQKHIARTFQLTKIIQDAVPTWYSKRKLHAATKTFQALRIAVNQELENIERALPQAAAVLEPKGRVVVISFHSLEDRIVKRFFATEPSLTPTTKKPVVPSLKEQSENPRSRSAKLRAAQKQ